MRLFDYAFCNNYDKKIQWLASLCPEKWSFGSSSDNLILKNYIDHTFSKLFEENKIIEKSAYAVFNTGLYTNYYEVLYAFFKVNTNEGRQKWFLDGFYTYYQLSSLGVADKLDRANYFMNPAE